LKIEIDFFIEKIARIPDAPIRRERMIAIRFHTVLFKVKECVQLLSTFFWIGFPTIVEPRTSDLLGEEINIGGGGMLLIINLEPVVKTPVNKASPEKFVIQPIIGLQGLCLRG
jgi:hypothetical protein